MTGGTACSHNVCGESSYLAFLNFFLSFVSYDSRYTFFNIPYKIFLFASCIPPRVDRCVTGDRGYEASLNFNVLLGMAARKTFIRTFLTCPLKTRNVYNRLKLNLNLIRCLSLTFPVKASKPVGSTEQDVYDVAIVGGGAMGSSSAYFLASRMSPGKGKICVIECDPTVRKRSELCRTHFDSS